MRTSQSAAGPMASTVVSHQVLSLPHFSGRDYSKRQSLSLSAFRSPTKLNRIKPLKSQSFPRIYVAQSNFSKVVQTAWKIGKDGIEAGTNLVPDSVPRPLARISVTAVSGFVVLFVFKSILSTAFFALGVMGLIYFTYIALNKDEGPKGGRGGGSGTTSTDDSLEEARRIMEKYK